MTPKLTKAQETCQKCGRQVVRYESFPRVFVANACACGHQPEPITEAGRKVCEGLKK